MASARGTCSVNSMMSSEQVCCCRTLHSRASQIWACCRAREFTFPVLKLHRADPHRRVVSKLDEGKWVTLSWFDDQHASRRGR